MWYEIDVFFVENDRSLECLFERGILQLDLVQPFQRLRLFDRQQFAQMQAEHILFEQLVVMDPDDLGYVGICLDEFADRKARVEFFFIAAEIVISLQNRLDDVAQFPEGYGVLLFACSEFMKS